MLKFGKGNAKLNKTIYTFSLPAGRTCPGANKCKSMAVEVDDSLQIKDGRNTRFRCFAASAEVLYRRTYEARKHNLDKLKEAKSKKRMVALINSSLPKKAKYIRLHVSGDFYSQTYFDAWCEVARGHPDITFYAYTKSIPFWVKRINVVPHNLILTASLGSKYDNLIRSESLRYAKVVFSEEEAEKFGLSIDHDDSHAIKHGKSFALLLHGVQPMGTKAAKAKAALGGKGSYPRK